MKKIILFLLLSTCYVLFATSSVSAQAPVSQSATVSATVVTYGLQLSGIAAPYASIVLTTNGAFLQSTVADQNGSFSVQNMSIGSNVSSICFTVIDVKRLGESVTCIPVPPVQSNTAINNIFLPPTLGLFRSQIVAGSTAILFGYSMPNARVTVSLNNNLIYSATADSTGYYEIQVPGLQPGVYQLVGTAIANGRPSLVPTKKVTLTAVTATEQLQETVRNVVTGIEKGLEDDGKDLVATTAHWWWLILLFFVALFFFIFFLWKRRKKKEKENVSNDSQISSNTSLSSTKNAKQNFVRTEQEVRN